ncbi:hypothetical protein JF540_13015 [Salipiger thiooxidans]|uniref:hypothetical protein n=1 Tax=Salipiger thiooxidans TaxID=282683 RepID=UPI001A8F2F10|nr:hypothetical protein [Salipiger thiooxidans]MBN8187612.1 hypothetical protein [Salipiger thiooxidans]
MSREVITVPYSLMLLTETNWWIDFRGKGSARNDDTTQVVSNAAPIWRGEMALVLHGKWAGEWRARHWAAEGRKNVYRLFMVDPLVFDRMAFLTDVSEALGVPFSTGARFATGMGFEAGPYVQAAEAASPGDTSITVTVPDPALVPVVGQIISARDWPMGVLWVEDLGGDQYRLGVKLQRATIAAGEAISLVATGLFEVAADDASSMSYGLSRVAQPGFTVREALKR